MILLTLGEEKENNGSESPQEGSLDPTNQRLP